MSPDTERPTVLIVEDEAIIAQNLQELLVRLGYDATGVATTAEEAVAQTAATGADVVLMDIRIGGALDGIATAALLRERFDVPVIYLTAHADEATIARARKTEPYGYLVKPVRHPDLQSALEIARYKHTMERQARSRERWFSTTMRSIADAVIAVDMAGKVTFMNEAAEQLVATTLSEAEGRPASEVIRVLDASSRPFKESPLEQALREEKPVYIAESFLRDANGVLKTIADSAAPVTDDGKVIGAVMVCRDVTAQRSLQRRLEMADRLASLGTMAAGVAHEINNPLAVVIANAQFVIHQFIRPAFPEGPPPDTLGEAPIDPAEAHAAQRELLQAAKRIADIVSDLKTYSRPRNDPNSSADVGKAIDWAVRVTANELRSRARLSTRVDDLPSVRIDDTRLGQVLVNLLTNAAQSIAPGNPANNEVAVIAKQEGARVVIEVRDTGSGIPPHTMDRIFEPFFTTKPIGIGTGLGLSISREIVASAGGEIDARSRVGEGTTFRISLPLSDRNRPCAPATEPSLPGRRGRILIVDDEDMVRAALERILIAHDVVCVAGGREALALLELDERFDVILCDIMMPGFTGVELYRELARAKPALARCLVFMSGGATSQRVQAFLDQALRPLVSKPFDLPELRALVQHLVDANTSTLARPTQH